MIGTIELYYLFKITLVPESKNIFANCLKNSPSIWMEFGILLRLISLMNLIQKQTSKKKKSFIVGLYSDIFFQTLYGSRDS